MKHAIITGGSGDLGQAIAAVFSAASWQVDSPSRLELDVTDPASLKNHFRGIAPDLLVCNAGITRDALLGMMAEEDWHQVMQVNFQGAASCAAAVLPGMRERKSGHIVFISSYSALHPPIGQAAYATAKAALLGLTRDLAYQHGSHNIRVNVILPGFLETKMTAGVTAQRRRQVLADHRLGRFNTPREVAHFLRFLHDELPHTSGQTFQLDSR